MSNWIEFDWRSVALMDTPEYQALAKRYQSDAEFRKQCSGQWCQAALADLAVETMSSERREHFHKASITEKHERGLLIHGIDD